MSTDEYKELMKFHILLTDINIEGANYAAVDTDGEMNVFEHKPETHKAISGVNNYYWVNSKSGIRSYIGIIEMPDDARVALVKL